MADLGSPVHNLAEKSLAFAQCAHNSREWIIEKARKGKYVKIQFIFDGVLQREQQMCTCGLVEYHINNMIYCRQNTSLIGLRGRLSVAIVQLEALRGEMERNIAHHFNRPDYVRAIYFLAREHRLPAEMRREIYQFLG